MKNKIQQGDVLFRKLTEKPEGIQEIISTRRCVLAEGEATGHAHVIEAEDAQLIQIGEKMLLSLTKESEVKHEEHKPVVLSPGLWEIGRVKEFDYFSKMVRPVAD